MNKLRRLKDFEKILASYEVSEANKQMLKQINLVLLVAPTSAGRNTIIRRLLKTGDYHFIISDTTRKPRVNDGVMEKNGVEYWFRSEEEVLSDLRAGNFLEAEIIHRQQVSGISLRELEKAQAEQKIAITDIDIGGVNSVLKAKPDAQVILILPPGFEEWQRRLKGRGIMNEDEHQRRMQTAAAIFAGALEQSDLAFVINDNIEDATTQVHNIAKLGTTDPQQQVTGRRLAEQLLIETNMFLENT